MNNDFVYLFIKLYFHEKHNIHFNRHPDAYSLAGK